MRERGNIYDDMYSLAMGCNSEVRSYSGCMVNGVQFYTVEHDNRRTTQNSGIMVSSDDKLNYYGVLNEILELKYAKRRRVIMFKCRWFDTDIKKNRQRVDLGFTSINTSQYWYVDEPFILANQVKQAFYLDDPKFGNSWKVVQVVQNQRIWDVPEAEDLGNDQLELLEVVGGIRVDESIQDKTLCRDNVDPTIVEQQIVQAQMNSDVPLNNDDDFINDENEDVEVSHSISSSLDEHSDSNRDSE